MSGNGHYLYCRMQGGGNQTKFMYSVPLLRSISSKLFYPKRSSKGHFLMIHAALHHCTIQEQTQTKLILFILDYSSSLWIRLYMALMNMFEQFTSTSVHNNC